MRISVSNIAWEPALDDDVGVVLRNFGVDAVDVAPGKYVSVPDATSRQLSDVRNAWGRRGMDIVGMQSLLFGSRNLALFGHKEPRAEMLARLEQACRVGAGLGARRLVFGSPKNRNLGGMSYDTALDIAATFFSSVGDSAALYGVTVMLEPNPREYGSTFMTTTAEAAAVVRLVAHPAIRLQLDLGASAMNEELVEDLVGEFGDLIGHVHLSQPHLAPVNESRYLTDAAPFVVESLPDHIACIEMLTDTDVLSEVTAAVRFATRHYGRPGEHA